MDEVKLLLVIGLLSCTSFFITVPGTIMDDIFIRKLELNWTATLKTRAEKMSSIACVSKCVAFKQCCSVLFNTKTGECILQTLRGLNDKMVSPNMTNVAYYVSVSRCKSIKCGPQPKITFARLEFSESEVGSTANYFCINGYAVGVSEISCGPDGYWRNASFECQVWTKDGCYTDQENRDMDDESSKSPTNSVSECINYCATGGYLHAAVQVELCSCDTVYGKYGMANDADCNQRCPGGQHEVCGGDFVNAVYRLGFPYMGTEYGDECFCGDNYGKYGLAVQGACTSPCAGNAHINCGGSWGLAVYFTGI